MTDQEALAAAQDARHKLLIGARAVEVEVIGTGGATYRTKFTPANREALDAYIQELTEKIAGKPRYGAIGFVF